MALIVDTNVLLDFPQVVQEQEDDIVILTDVLRELDGLKLHANPEVAYKARRAAVVISRNIEHLIYNDDFEDQKMSVDDKLLTVASSCNGTLITNDVYLKIKAIIKKIDTKGFGGIEEYTGVRTLLIAADEGNYHAELEYILENRKLPDTARPLREGEYVIIKNLSKPFKTKDGGTDYEELYIGVNKNGQIEQIMKSAIINKWIGKITPRNPEQICLFHALSMPTKTILYAGGSFGRGKSFLLNNYALQELEMGHINKIVYVPNNSYTENTLDLGALPGDLLEKTIGLVGPLLDLVGIDEIQSMLNRGQLEIVPINTMRGRSFKDSIIIVNEAQNLTEEHVKLLIARCDEGTRIFFDGDLKQADSAIFRNKSGLSLLTQLSKSPVFAKLFAAVKLVSIERSETAQASNYLDEITGNI